MNSVEVEKWLISESKKKNSLAEAYLSLLANATPEMKEFWYQQLGTMLVAAKEIEKQAKQEK